MTRRWREMDSNFWYRARRNQEISASRWSSADLVYGTVAQISAEPSGRHTREQYRADKCPVDGKGRSREALEDAQKDPDRDKGREAADNEADGEHQPAVRIEAGVTWFRQLLQAGESDGGKSEQEGEPCCLLALEAKEECCRQRRARARYAGISAPTCAIPTTRQLRSATRDRSLMPREQLGKAEQQRYDDASDTDDFEAADRGGAGVEQLGENKPGNADRYRADRDPEGELERAVGEGLPMTDNEPNRRSLTSRQK
jgi:hypothetical protein